MFLSFNSFGLSNSSSCDAIQDSNDRTFDGTFNFYSFFYVVQIICRVEICKEIQSKFHVKLGRVDRRVRYDGGVCLQIYSCIDVMYMNTHKNICTANTHSIPIIFTHKVHRRQ